MAAPSNLLWEAFEQAAKHRARLAAEASSGWIDPKDVPLGPAWAWGVDRCAPPAFAVAPRLSIEDARVDIRSAAERYLALPKPPHILLCRSSPGSGKTALGALLSEYLTITRRWRVLYAGPRHDFFGDVLQLAEHPELWYEWLPRQAGNTETGKAETCRYATAIGEWQSRGYESMRFCEQLCGWQYVRHSCPYHAQRRRPEPIIFGQHQHVSGGHPLRFQALIGDECPLGSFGREWRIPAKFVYARTLDLEDDLAELMERLDRLVSGDMALHGPALIDALGGPERVLQATDSYTFPALAKALNPGLRSSDDVYHLDYFYLPAFIPLLRREAAAAQTGEPYLHRIEVDDQHLLLCLRRYPDSKLPDHVIWFDASGTEHLYRAMFGREVEVIEPAIAFRGRLFQVADRANGKGKKVDSDGDDAPDAQQPDGRLAKRLAEVDVIAGRYQSVGVITHQAWEKRLSDRYQTGHYYAERGTNRFGAVDALILLGTPTPPLETMTRLAMMLYFHRMTPFSTDDKIPWSTRAAYPYNYVDPVDQMGRCYPKSGFWGDDDLQALLWQYREAELIQAVHRARPALREVDVWLLSNLPVDELPPTRILRFHELVGAPAHADPYVWLSVLQVATEQRMHRQRLYASELVRRCGVNRYTAGKYLGLLVEIFPEQWRWPEKRSDKAGAYIVPVVDKNRFTAH